MASRFIEVVLWYKHSFAMCPYLRVRTRRFGIGAMSCLILPPIFESPKAHTAPHAPATSVPVPEIAAAATLTLRAASTRFGVSCAEPTPWPR